MQRLVGHSEDSPRFYSEWGKSHKRLLTRGGTGSHLDFNNHSSFWVETRLKGAGMEAGGQLRRLLQKSRWTMMVTGIMVIDIRGGSKKQIPDASWRQSWPDLLTDWMWRVRGIAEWGVTTDGWTAGSWSSINWWGRQWWGGQVWGKTRSWVLDTLSLSLPVRHLNRQLDIGSEITGEIFQLETCGHH